ncbi:protein of unknown function DUF89 [Reticulomyxa filosa]|uniref:Sugar phosphate phosphatase n=1 Tax=Reticulomyxa filosa TaxID=46433 RepID=X6M7W6_RETFI|nr:protein of unknown function DUF89 [Reticulomyxa filosa]|eukprot:ETO09736.1 protein of unknown function DUF89 [Reticulomyxa filosa]
MKCNLDSESKQLTSISFICDNSGAEFLHDLLLADFLLFHRFCDKIYLHVKLYPTYVSDVTREDVDLHVGHLFIQTSRHSELKEFYDRISHYLSAHLIEVVESHFWNTALMFNQMTTCETGLLCYQLFQKDALTFIKGDANYRRVVSCRKWKPSTPLKDVVDYFPTSFVLLRTMKSDAVIGVPEETAVQLDKTDEHWRHNGKRGLIQFFHKNLQKK